MLYPDHCRCVAYRQVDFELTETNLARHLSKHRYYRGSRYQLLKHGDEWAVVALELEPADTAADHLFLPLAGYRLLSLPAATAYVRDPAVDVLNPSSLVGRARAEVVANPKLTTLILQGEFNHLSFVHQPALLTLHLHDFTPPQPAKLLTQATRVLAYHDLGLPVALEPHLTDLTQLAASTPTELVALPCAAGEAAAPGKTLCYLDHLPPVLAQAPATLIGCQRSLDIFKAHYGHPPAHFRGICPAEDDYLKHQAAAPPAVAGLHLAKCCLIKSGFEARGNVAFVGWGATLADVEAALRYLVQRAVKAGVAPVNEAA